MKNIFGKTHEDYKHLQKLSSVGFLDSHLKALDQDFKDADIPQAFGFQTNNLQSIQSEIEEILYLQFRLDGLVPINRNIPEGADSYAYRVKNSYGKGKFIDTYSTNAESAQVSYGLTSSSIYQGGLDAEWSLQELRSAKFAGIALDTDTIDAATVGCLNHIEEVGLTGDSDKGLTGLINNADVPVVHEVAANSIATSADPAAYINDYINKIIEDTSTIFSNRITQGLTIYLPVKQYNYLATKFFGDNADKSLMEYLMRFNAWTANTGNPIEFKIVIELKDAGLLSDLVTPADRMLIGFNDRKVMEMGNPIMPRVIGIMDMKRKFLAPMEYSISQLNFKQPKGCLYVDGV